jgi:hypothetical protein
MRAQHLTGTHCCLPCLQLCVQLCDTYKQQYIRLRDAVKLDNPEKVTHCTVCFDG